MLCQQNLNRCAQQDLPPRSFSPLSQRFGRLPFFPVAQELLNPVFTRNDVWYNPPIASPRALRDCW
jgi:hypothetical protein